MKRKFDLTQETYGWYVVSDREEDLKESVSWYTVVDENPIDTFDKMTACDKAKWFFDDNIDIDSLFVRKATYQDLLDAIDSAPGWDCGKVVGMLLELCDFLEVDHIIEDTLESYDDLYNYVCKILD